MPISVLTSVMALSLLAVTASGAPLEVAPRPLKTVEFVVPNSPTKAFDSLNARLDACQQSLKKQQTPVIPVPPDRLNPELAEAYGNGAGPWEDVNFTGLGQVKAKVVKGKTIVLVPAKDLREAIRLMAEGMTHLFRCGDGNSCIVLDNSALRIQ